MQKMFITGFCQAAVLQLQFPFSGSSCRSRVKFQDFYDLGAGSGGQLFDDSLAAARALNNIAAENGAQTLFLMTWGHRHGDQERNPQLYPSFLTMQRYLAEGYMRYVKETYTKQEERQTFVAPVGLVFETIYNDDVEAGLIPTHPGTLFYELYSDDGSHPSLAGSYVAALTIYTTITGKNPKEVVWFPPTTTNLGRVEYERIQDAVSRTILETYASQAIEYPWEMPWANDDETFVISEL
jgi:hypothetical protein